MSPVAGEPIPTPETLPFWEGTRAGELRLPWCLSCERPFFYPRLRCPACASGNITWRAASGVGTLLSYVINHRPMVPAGENGPQVIAIIQLAEGPRMTTNIVDCDPDPKALVLGARVHVTFRPLGDQVLPVFRLSEDNA